MMASPPRNAAAVVSLGLPVPGLTLAFDPAPSPLQPSLLDPALFFAL